MSTINIKINGKNIKLYQEDTNESFRNRVASLFDTLPDYVEPFTLEQLDHLNDNKIHILTEDIENDESISIEDFFTKRKIIQTYAIPQTDYETLKNIAKLWLQYAETRLKEMLDEYQLGSIYLLNEDILRKMNIYFNIERFIKEDVKSFYTEYRKKVKQIKEKDKEYTNIFKSLDASTDFLPFIKENSTIRFKTDISEKQRTLSNIFSDLICDENVPFISHTVYKLYQEFRESIPLEWKEDSEFEMEQTNPSILLRIYNQEKVSKTFQSQYFSKCIIYYTNTGELIISLDMDHTLKLKEHLLLERIFTIFKKIKGFSIRERVETRITGITLFPRSRFNIDIMNELIMNHPSFSYFMAIDESIKATKKKPGNCHFFINGLQHSCSILSKETRKDDPDIKSISRKLLGTMFVRLRVKHIKTISLVNQITSIFSKLLSLYEKEREEVIKFYRKFVKSFALKELEEIPELDEYVLKDIAPDVFVGDYTRSCTHPPIVTEDDEKRNKFDYEENIEKEDDGDPIEHTEKEPLLFPKKSSEGPQHFYSCEHHPDHPYPGVIENNLENQEKYPYIPCCFAMDQLNKTGTGNPTREYYYNKMMKQTAQQNILTTNKFAPPFEYAYLPPYLNTFFSIFGQTDVYLRSGVENTKHSFLECVLQALHPEFRDMPKAERFAYLSSEFEKLVNNPNIAVVMQETPGETEESLRESLSRNVYMDPRRWIRLCEEVYQCKIYVFSRRKNEAKVELMIPYHKLNHLSYKLNRIVLFLYEHYGNEKHVSYPRCELVVKMLDKSKDLKEYTFTHSKTTKKLIQHSIRHYSLNVSKNKIKEISIYNEEKFPFSSQIVDNYGKTRGFYISEDDLFFFSTPLPPIFSPLYKGNVYRTYPIQKVMMFIQKYDLTIRSQVIKHKKLKEITFYSKTNKNVLFTVKIDPVSKKIDNISTIDKENYPSSSSYMKDILTVKRTAHLLTEYFLYYYSKWHSEIHPNDPITLKTLNEFRKSYIVYDKNVIYDIPESPYVSLSILEFFGYIADNKFIIPDEETLKRLIYVLRLRMTTQYETLLSYHLRNEIYNFYTENKYYGNDQNIITESLDIVSPIDNHLYEKVQPFKEKYFMKNKNLSKQPVFLVDVEDAQTAKAVSSHWNRKKCISDDIIDKDYYEDGRTYFYQSSSTIRKRGPKGGSEIMVYRALDNKGENEVLHSLAICKL